MKKWTPTKEGDGADISERKTKCFTCRAWSHISIWCNKARRQSQSSAKPAVDLKTNWALSANEDMGHNPNL